MKTNGMDKVMREISIMMYGSTTDPRGNFPKYQHLLPSEVQFIKFLNGTPNCATYALGFPHLGDNTQYWIDELYNEVETPNSGGIYTLCNHGEWVHVGKTIDSEKAESKWGWKEPVFRHPILFYPGDHDEIKFFTKKSDYEEILNQHNF